MEIHPEMRSSPASRWADCRRVRGVKQWVLVVSSVVFNKNISPQGSSTTTTTTIIIIWYASNKINTSLWLPDLPGCEEHPRDRLGRNEVNTKAFFDEVDDDHNGLIAKELMPEFHGVPFPVGWSGYHEISWNIWWEWDQLDP